MRFAPQHWFAACELGVHPGDLRCCQETGDDPDFLVTGLREVAFRETEAVEVDHRAERSSEIIGPLSTSSIGSDCSLRNPGRRRRGAKVMRVRVGAGCMMATAAPPSVTVMASIAVRRT